MEFHPGKCENLRITNLSTASQIKADYIIHSTTLAHTNSAKYLGVTIDSNLQWNEHQANIISKANSTLAFLRRNIPFCPQHVKNTCYKTFVRPVLEYGCCVWDPQQGNHTLELEKIQKRAARFVTGIYNLTHGRTARNQAQRSAEPKSKLKSCTRLNWVPLTFTHLT